MTSLALTATVLPDGSVRFEAVYQGTGTWHAAHTIAPVVPRPDTHSDAAQLNWLTIELLSRIVSIDRATFRPVRRVD